MGGSSTGAAFGPATGSGILSMRQAAGLKGLVYPRLWRPRLADRPGIAAFEGGLVVGYIRRIWEKMSIYERVFQEAVSREAEQQVESEVESQVEREVEQQVEEMQDEMEAEVESPVESRVETEVDKQVEERLPDETQDYAVFPAETEKIRSGVPIRIRSESPPRSRLHRSSVAI